MRYKFGNGPNIFMSYSEAADGLSAAALGATLARFVTGDASQFIPRSIASFVDS